METSANNFHIRGLKRWQMIDMVGFCLFDSLFEFFLPREKCYEIFFQVWPLLNYSDKNIFHCQPADKRMTKELVSSYFSYIF